MIVLHIGSLCLRLAYIYESYTYDSPTVTNDTRTQIELVDFSCIRQSYAYDNKTHVFTSHSDVHANYMLRIHMRMPIIRKRSTLEVYAYN